MLVLSLFVAGTVQASEPFISGIRNINGGFHVFYGPGGWQGFSHLYNGPLRYIEVRYGNGDGTGTNVSATAVIPWELYPGAGVLTPVTATMKLTAASPAIGTPITGVVDTRTPTQIAAAPKFDFIYVRQSSNNLLANGKIAGFNGNPADYAIEYWTGSGWASLSNFLPNQPFIRPTGAFTLRAVGSTSPPIVRVRRSNESQNFGYATQTIPGVMEYGRVRAPLSPPSGAASRFLIRAKTVAVGVRG